MDTFLPMTLMHYVQKLDRITFFRQTLFGLSWMLAACLLAYCQPQALPVAAETWGYIFLAFFSARTAGMCLNRLIDRYIDRQNPRTCNRPLQKGEVSVQFTALQTVFFLLLFFFATIELGPICFTLSLLVGLLLCIYSYLKRFTMMCHFVLGVVHLFVPITCWAALTHELSIIPLFLGLSLLCSIAAADIIYACQDIDFDRAHGLCSVPAWGGTKRAIEIAKFLHCMAVLFLFLFCDFFSDRKLLVLGCLAVSYIYYMCYKKLTKEGYEKSFSFANTFSGITFFLFVLVDCLWRV